MNTSIFFFNDSATTDIFPLSLHDSLPISFISACGQVSKHLKQSALACLAPPKTSTQARFMNLHRLVKWADQLLQHAPPRSEEHTSELQSPCNIVCRLMLEKKNIIYCYIYA